ncbi:hypothetical protein [Enterobacter roggenkampii]|uniref:hypothetical protein n=1 Tax=Enterobacter roggenkampii TaxID=1812935 RepID=UPI00200630BA|nr:hypothetical protein [Enterobacter roggenkampii]MCK6840544.1 hypothetical protein [Enterobacter roggenkampii]
MEFKGTKGEWEIMMDDDEIKVIQSSSLENGSGWRSYVAICEEVQCIEDAKLIAAAHDLLKELQRLRDYVINICDVDEDDCHIEHPLMSSRAAISKALGEE